MIDIISLLDDEGIDYKQSGSNVSRGWVEINCPFPFCGDPSYHMGINLEKELFNCWVCGEKGGLPKLISTLLNINYYQAKDLIKKYETLEVSEEKEIVKTVDSDLLKPFDSILPKPHRDYLIKRKFDPDFIQQRYLIHSCWKTGEYPYRIIIPVIENGRVVNLTARDITDKQKPKYKNLSNEKAVIPMKECLYNIDSVKGSMLIVEGHTDTWRIGDGAIATMGVEFTVSQLKLINSKNVKRAFVLYDAGVIKEANKLGNALSPLINHVEILHLDKGDPGEMSEEEVKQLRKEIGL